MWSRGAQHTGSIRASTIGPSGSDAQVSGVWENVQENAYTKGVYKNTWFSLLNVQLLSTYIQFIVNVLNYCVQEHMAIHAGITDLYTCWYCPKTFRSSSNMYKHRKLVHSQEWETQKQKLAATMVIQPRGGDLLQATINQWLCVGFDTYYHWNPMTCYGS